MSAVKVLHALMISSLISVGSVNFYGSSVDSSISLQVGASTNTAITDKRSPEFTLSISTSRSKYRVGEVIVIWITEKNITNESIPFAQVYKGYVDESFKYDVRNEDNNPAAKVQVNPLSSVDAYSHSIAAGQSRKEAIPINALYKLDEPGKYTIQVSKFDEGIKDSLGNPILVSSNKISIYIYE